MNNLVIIDKEKTLSRNIDFSNYITEICQSSMTEYYQDTLLETLFGNIDISERESLRHLLIVLQSNNFDDTFRDVVNIRLIKETSKTTIKSFSYVEALDLVISYLSNKDGYSIECYNIDYLMDKYLEYSIIYRIVKTIERKYTNETISEFVNNIESTEVNKSMVSQLVDIFTNNLDKLYEDESGIETSKLCSSFRNVFMSLIIDNRYDNCLISMYFIARDGFVDRFMSRAIYYRFYNPMFYAIFKYNTYLNYCAIGELYNMLSDIFESDMYNGECIKDNLDKFMRYLNTIKSKELTRPEYVAMRETFYNLVDFGTNPFYVLQSLVLLHNDINYVKYSKAINVMITGDNKVTKEEFERFIERTFCVLSSQTQDIKLDIVNDDILKCEDFYYLISVYDKYLESHRQHYNNVIISSFVDNAVEYIASKNDLSEFTQSHNKLYGSVDLGGIKDDNTVKILFCYLFKFNYNNEEIFKAYEEYKDFDFKQHISSLSKYSENASNVLWLLYVMNMGNYEEYSEVIDNMQYYLESGVHKLDNK